MKLLLVAAASALVILSVTAGSALAGSGPNYDCARQNQRCVAACDEGADQGKNAKKYQACLDNCDRADKSCTERQDVADGCAISFKACIEHAHGEADKERCRKSYRSCKGTP